MPNCQSTVGCSNCIQGCPLSRPHYTGICFLVLKLCRFLLRIRVIVFNATFNNISAMSYYYIVYYHPSLPLYLPADSMSKTRIKVHVS